MVGGRLIRGRGSAVSGWSCIFVSLASLHLLAPLVDDVITKHIIKVVSRPARDEGMAGIKVCFGLHGRRAINVLQIH